MSEEDRARIVRFIETVLHDLRDRPPGVETVGIWVKRLENIEDRLHYCMETLRRGATTDVHSRG